MALGSGDPGDSTLSAPGEPTPVGDAPAGYVAQDSEGEEAATDYAWIEDEILAGKNFEIAGTIERQADTGKYQGDDGRGDQVPTESREPILLV